MAFRSPFEVESTSDELTVKRQAQTSAFTTILSIGGIFYCLYRVMPFFSSSPIERQSLGIRPDNPVWTACFVSFMVGIFLFAAASLAFQILRSLFPSGETLHCDHENLVIGKIQ